MTIEKILKLQDTYEFEEFGSVGIVSVKKKELNLEIKTLIYTGIDNEAPQSWQIICHKAKKHKITLGEQDGDFELFNNHVLLWSYQQSVSSLTFNKVNSNIDAYYVIGKLYEKHTSLVNCWIPFDDCFNELLNLPKLINYGHGKLAEGAEKLIIGYQEVLQECGFKSSYISRPPMQWNDKQGWIAEDNDLQVLIIDKSYAIANEFTAKQLAN